MTLIRLEFSLAWAGVAITLEGRVNPVILCEDVIVHTDHHGAQVRGLGRRDSGQCAPRDDGDRGEPVAVCAVAAVGDWRRFVATALV